MDLQTTHRGLVAMIHQYVTLGLLECKQVA